MDQTIDTADVVKHAPSGEEWVVACVRGDRLSWCGWPEGTAALADCTLVRKATPDQRQLLLQDMAASSSGDHRARYARTQLAKGAT